MADYGSDMPLQIIFYLGWYWHIMWTGRNHIVYHCQYCFGLYTEFFKEDDRECLQMDFCCSLWVAHWWAVVESAFCLEVGIGQVGTSWSCLPGLGSLLSSAGWVLSLWNLNLERILNAGIVSSGSRVTKITKILSWVVLVTHTNINIGELNLYFCAFYIYTDTPKHLLCT